MLMLARGVQRRAIVAVHKVQHKTCVLARPVALFAPHSPRRCLRVLAAKAETKAGRPTPKSAKEAVETGLVAFAERKDYDEAVRMFRTAMELKPTSEEAAAALFNMGCAYARQRKFKEAADAIGEAINKHQLKISVALKVWGWASSSSQHGTVTVVFWPMASSGRYRTIEACLC